MKIPHKRELQQLTITDTSEFDSKGYDFFLKKIKQNIKIDEMVRDKKKMQYNINRGAQKITALSSDKIDKYDYLTGDKIVPTD